jgi:hypothetical protein
LDIPTDLAELTKLFEKFGATDAEGLATSQLQEGIPQLQRFLFLRQAWRRIIDDADVSWVDRDIADTDAYPNAPYAGVGGALKRAVNKGVSRRDLTDIARGVQARLLFELCYLLDDPSFPEAELCDFTWGLFEADANDSPVAPRIGALHESVLTTDPTGRGMRPRGEDA